MTNKTPQLYILWDCVQDRFPFPPSTLEQLKGYIKDLDPNDSNEANFIIYEARPSKLNISFKAVIE